MTRYVDVRFDVLRSGSVISQMQPAATPSIVASAASAIKTSFFGEFYFNSAADWLIDELRPVLIINGIEHFLGIFSVTDYSATQSESSNTVTISGHDRCWRVQSTLTERILHLSQGMPYLEAIKHLLLDCGITLVVATPSSAVLASDREDWDLGTDYLTIINSLLSEINYNDLWFDADGYARIEPKAEVISANIKHTFDSSNIRSLILPEKTTSCDIYSAPNVFICICSNPDFPEPLVATAVNDNPASPLSVPRRKRRISRVVKVNNIASQEELEVYAQLLMRDSMMSVDTVSIPTALLPGFGVNEVVAVNYGDSQGICLETGYTMELVSGGTMRHELRKVGYNFG